MIKKIFVFDNTQKKKFETRFAIYIVTYQTHNEMKMNEFFTNIAFNFELKQMLKNNFLTKSVMNEKIRNDVTKFVVENRNFRNSQNMISINSFRFQTRHFRQIDNILK